MEDSTTLLNTDAAIQPLLEAAKGSLNNVSTIRAVFLKAVSHSEIFCGYDQLKALVLGANIDDAPLLATLDLFSYGQYADFVQQPSQYLPLNETQIAKLRQLTLISCVHEACNRGYPSLSYASIGEALQISDQRAMEQVIISCVYTRAINGRLCQKSRQFQLTEVPPCISRDVPLSGLPKLLQQLEALQDRLSSSYDGLEGAHTSVTKSLEQSAAFWNAIQEREARAQSQVSNKQPAAVSGSGNNSGTVRLAGWPESSVGTRRSSASRQSKRSRGGFGGSFTDPFQRY